MEGNIVYTPPVPHYCEVPREPTYGAFVIGTIWQCGECGRYWEWQYGDWGNCWFKPSRKARKIIKKLNQDQPRAKVV